MSAWIHFFTCCELSFFRRFHFWTRAFVAVPSFCPTNTFPLGHYISNAAEVRSWLPLRLLVSCICCCCVFITRINVAVWFVRIEWRLKISQTEGHQNIPLENLNLLQDCLNSQVIDLKWTFSQLCSYLSDFSFFLQHNILTALIRYGIVENDIVMLW